QIWMPGTFVGTGPYGPRIVSGVSGFGSKVSRWLGPPSSQRKMHAASRSRLCAPGDAEVERSQSASVKPAKVSPPTRSISRRVRPLHLRTLVVPMVNMVSPPKLADQRAFHAPERYGTDSIDDRIMGGSPKQSGNLVHRQYWNLGWHRHSRSRRPR